MARPIARPWPCGQGDREPEHGAHRDGRVRGGGGRPQRKSSCEAATTRRSAARRTTCRSACGARNQYQKACFYARLANEKSRAIADANWIARCHNLMGNLHLVRSRLEPALREYRKALAIRLKEPRLNEFGVGILRDNIGYCLLLLEKHEEGIREILEARELAERVGNRRLLCDCSTTSHSANMQLRKLEEAEREGSGRSSSPRKLERATSSRIATTCSARSTSCGGQRSPARSLLLPAPEPSPEPAVPARFPLHSSTSATSSPCDSPEGGLLLRRLAASDTPHRRNLLRLGRIDRRRPAREARHRSRPSPRSPRREQRVGAQGANRDSRTAERRRRSSPRPPTLSRISRPRRCSIRTPAISWSSGIAMTAAS